MARHKCGRKDKNAALAERARRGVDELARATERILVRCRDANSLAAGRRAMRQLATAADHVIALLPTARQTARRS